MNNTFKTTLVWLAILMVLMTVFNQFNDSVVRAPESGPLEYSEFIKEVQAGRIAKVTM